MALEGGWVPLNPYLPLEERLLPEEVAPALAFQYRLRLDLAFDIPSVPGVGQWANTHWEEWRVLNWNLRLYDPDRMVSGPVEGLEDVWDEIEEFFGDTGDIEGDRGVTYKDEGQALFWIVGVLHGLEAYTYVWFYDEAGSGFVVRRPSGARLRDACDFEGVVVDPAPLCGQSGEMVQPPTGEDFTAGRGWIFVDWTSPVIYAPLADHVLWRLQPTGSFDEVRWSLWMRRVAAFGGTLDIDADEIIHWTDNVDGVMALREAIGGRTRYVTRKQALREGMEYGFPAHRPDGRLSVLGWAKDRAVLTHTRDAGTNWGSAYTVPGNGPPLCLRAGRDGELHTLRYTRENVVYQRLREDGAVSFQSPIARSGAVGSAVLETRRHGIIEAHLSSGRRLETYQSCNGGVTWRQVQAIQAPGLVMDARTGPDGNRHVLSSDGDVVRYTQLNLMGHGRYTSTVDQTNHLNASLARRGDGEMLAQLLDPKRNQYSLTRDSGVNWRRL